MRCKDVFLKLSFPLESRTPSISLLISLIKIKYKNYSHFEFRRSAVIISKANLSSEWLWALFIIIKANSGVLNV